MQSRLTWRIRYIFNNKKTGVGKTSIISRYINNTFQSNFIPTMGSCFASKTLNFEKFGKSVKFEVYSIY